jgi:hypothetical protein
VVARVIAYARQDRLDSLRIDSPEGAAYLRGGDDRVGGDLRETEAVKK